MSLALRALDARTALEDLAALKTWFLVAAVDLMKTQFLPRLPRRQLLQF